MFYRFVTKIKHDAGEAAGLQQEVGRANCLIQSIPWRRAFGG
jgi:hypothetical protein